MVEIIRAFLNGLNIIVILWLLSVKPRHGYEIIKEIERLTGVNSNPSAIYSFLHSLEEEGLILGRWIMDKKARRCYFLTAKGERLLNRLKSLFNKQLRVFTESLMYPSRSKRPLTGSS
ncbi:PadR family transcriptional regulator [Candidatus Bathyarchaeota archaeon]|nr:PadR family transcriptional regulator [Candidatus Bathyarchaeota archaeon]